MNDQDWPISLQHSALPQRCTGQGGWPSSKDPKHRVQSEDSDSSVENKTYSQFIKDTGIWNHKISYWQALQTRSWQCTLCDFSHARLIKKHTKIYNFNSDLRSCDKWMFHWSEPGGMSYLVKDMVHDPHKPLEHIQQHLYRTNCKSEINHFIYCYFRSIILTI